MVGNNRHYGKPSASNQIETESGDSYGGWVIGGLVAIAIVMGIIFYGAWVTPNDAPAKVVVTIPAVKTLGTCSVVPQDDSTNKTVSLHCTDGEYVFTAK